MFCSVGSVLDSGKYFGFWEVFCPYGPPYRASNLLTNRSPRVYCHLHFSWTVFSVVHVRIGKDSAFEKR